MRHPLSPISCKPWSLNGLSERLIANHYENEYGAAVRALNGILEELEALDLTATPAHQVRAIKREELAAWSSVQLHELYFEALGGDGATLFTGSGPGSPMETRISSALAAQFGSVSAWRQQFVAIAKSLSHGSGWVALMYGRRDGRLFNQIALDHSHAAIDAAPMLVLDMYEHAYQIDFGSNASGYIDAFMRNIDWAVVNDRLVNASEGGALRRAADRGPSLPSVSVEELSGALVTRERVQIIDARPKHYFSRTTDMMRGAVWHDPDRVHDWASEVSADKPVFVYCAYGYSVGCGVTAVLRDRGIDAKYVRGGLSAWYAAGGARDLSPQRNP